MRYGKKIIISSCCIEFLFIVSSLAAGQSDTDKLPSTWDLVRQEMTKKTEPNKPIQSQESVQPIQSGAPVKSVESVKTKVAVETVQSLLDKYAEYQDKIQSSFRIKTRSISHGATNHPVVPNPGEWTYRILERDYCYDVNRYSVRLNRWLDLDSKPEESLPENHPSFTYLRHMWDGNNVYSYAWSNKNEESKSGSLSISMNSKPSDISLIPTGPFFGRFSGSLIRIDKILGLYENGVSLRDEMEKVGDFNCYVIDANVSHGKYTLWFDPAHDYQLVRAEVIKKEGDLADEVSGGKLEKGFIITDSYLVTRFEQFDGVWISAETIDKGGSEWPTNQYSKGETTREVISFTLNPDFKKLKSFELDEVKNGADVSIISSDSSTIKYTWKDGKIFDGYGYELNQSTLKKPSLLNTTLPSIAEFGVDLNPDVFKNNKLLICFFDYSQRPSRNCVLTLNEKTESLLDKDIFLIFIQSESVTEQTLAAWLTQNKIVPPVGTSKIDLPALGQRWGVQSLPWLILTDKQHKVTAEGFGIAYLDEKIKD